MPSCVKVDAEHQRRCLIRQICAWGGKAEAYLTDVVMLHGQKRADELRKEAREQYLKGNRGKWGAWK